MLSNASPAWAQSSPAALAAARLRQEWTPEFKARKETAVEQIKAAEAYFEGDQEVSGAWPELEGVPLLSLPYVQGALLQLDQRAEQRNAQRLLPAPSDLSPTDTRRYLLLRDGALDAEERADQLKRRLLIGLSAGLKRAPGLQQDQLDAQIAQWRVASTDIPRPGEAGHAEAVERARIAGELEAIAHRYTQASVLAMTVPGDLSLQRLSSADIGRQRSTPQTRIELQAALDRLQRIQPLLPEENAQRVQAFIDEHQVAVVDEQILALQTTLAELTEQPVRGLEGENARQVIDNALLAAEQRLADVTEETADVLSGEAPTDPLGARRRVLAGLQLEIAQTRLAMLEEQRDLLTEEAVRTAEQGALESQAQVDDAQRKAEEARRLAEAAGKAELAEIARRLQELSDALALEEPPRQQAAASEMMDVTSRQQALHDRVQEAFLTPPLARREAVQQVYGQALIFLAEVRSAVRQRQDVVRRFSTENTQIRQNQFPSDEDIRRATELDVSLLSSIQGSVNATEEALTGRREQALLEQDEMVRVLRMVRADTRRLREGLPPGMRSIAEQNAGIDFLIGSWDEAADVGPLLAESLRQVQYTDSWTVRGVSHQLLRLVESSLGLVLIVLMWNLAQRRGASWIEQWLLILQKLTPRGNPIFQPWLDLRLDGLSVRLQPMVRPAIALLAGWLVYALLSSPVLELLALLWVARASLQLVSPGLDLLLVPPDSQHFGLQSTADTRERVKRSIRWLVRWWMASILVHHTAYAVLHTDLLAERLRGVLLLLFAGVCLRELLRWSDAIIGLVAALNGDGWLQRWVTATEGGRISKLLRAGTGLVLLTVFGLQRLLHVLIEGRGRMGWVGSIIAQHSLKEIHSDCPPLDERDRQKLQTRHEAIFLHHAEVDRIMAAYTAWQHTRRLGLVALIGERGAGKSTLLEHIARTAPFDGMSITTLQPRGVLEHEEEAREWLCSSLRLRPGSETLLSWPEIRDALLAMPPRVLLIDDVHRLMLRTVGGFAGLRETLTLMHTTAHHHFWVVGFHRPAWSFLEGSAAPINLDVFRACIDLSPLDPSRVSLWLTTVTAAADMDFGFGNLASSLLNTMEPTRELSRIETAFWRRITDVTHGNPEVLFSYWLDSLRHPPPDADTPPTERETLEVALLEPLDATLFESLPDIDLFVLTSIVIHDGLAVSELALSLNAPRGQLRSSCRHLEGMGVLMRDVDNMYRVKPRWRPTVNRLLRQRHFLHQR